MLLYNLLPTLCFQGAWDLQFEGSACGELAAEEGSCPFSLFLGSLGLCC